MSLRYYANAPATTLASSCSSGATLISVTSVAGLPIQYPYTLILDRGQATEEAVSVTAASGTDLTVTRAIDNTTAFAHSASAPVEHGITAQDIREPNAHINATDNVHGVTGNVVGDADAQTLTNKDLSSATNTFPSSLATDVELAAEVAASRPIGEVTMYAGSIAPTGWLLCDGAAVSRATYATLFANIGTTYGAGDGSTTFNLPDLRDRAPVGASGTKALGSEGGTDEVTLATTNLPSHTHSITHDHADTQLHFTHFDNSVGGGSGGRVTDIENSGPGGGTSETVALNNVQFTGNSGSTGSGTAFSVQNPYVGINFIIRAE